MAPFDVKVLTIISGEVKTNILRNDFDRELPQESFYAPLALEFKQHVQRVPDAVDRFVYAANVARHTLNPSPPAWFWFGGSSLVIRFLDMFGWRTVWDSIFSRMFKLDRLRKKKST